MKNKITLSDLYEFKAAGKKFSCLTCYDYTTAKILAQSNIEMVMVGDSAAQIVLGHPTTLPVDMDFMVAITAGVRRAVPNKILVADMPFLSYQISNSTAIENAGRFVREAGADIIKIEASRAQIDVVKAVSDAGMSVMAHIGIRPQSISKTGKLKAQGITAQDAKELIDLANDMIDAGATILLLEGSAREVAKIITDNSPIPVLSCGAGPDCDGQVLVISDVLGLSDGDGPKFSKSFGNVGEIIKAAIDEYERAVHDGSFPDDTHCYHMRAAEIEKLR